MTKAEPDQPQPFPADSEDLKRTAEDVRRQVDEFAVRYARDFLRRAASAAPPIFVPETMPWHEPVEQPVVRAVDADPGISPPVWPVPVVIEASAVFRFMPDANGFAYPWRFVNGQYRFEGNGCGAVIYPSGDLWSFDVWRDGENPSIEERNITLEQARFAANLALIGMINEDA